VSEAFMIMLREGFEATLIVAIVFTYLRKIDRLDLSAAVWSGVAFAAGIATGLGLILHWTIGDFEGRARLLTFAAICATAAVVLTWMIFWMRKQSRAIKNELHEKVDAAIASDTARRGVMFVAFIAVLREGIESALFLVAAATGDNSNGVFVGAIAGLVAACVLGYLVYSGGRQIPMATFFKVTGILLILFAAGLLSRTVFFLQAAGDIGTMNNAFYNVTGIHWLTVDTQTGRFLAGIFGWDPRPSIEQVIVYVGYVVPVSYLFLRASKGAAPVPATKQSTAQAVPTAGR
jgi:high-affinity iron transporter